MVDIVTAADGRKKQANVGSRKGNESGDSLSGGIRREEMKVISSDLLRGHIDTFVLSALMDGTKYGNEIRKYISQKTNNLYIPNEQSLYSAYHRLEDMECIRGYWGENVGATRKYYTITDKGRQVYEINKREWENAKRLIDILIK